MSSKFSLLQYPHVPAQNVKGALGVAVSVSASQHIKLMKSVISLVSKKRKVTAIVCVFYEKRRLKMRTLKDFLKYSTSRNCNNRNRLLKV